MHEGNGGAGLALQGAKETEQLGHGPRGVLVLLVKSDKRVQDEEAGLVLSDGRLEPLAIVGPIQAQRVGRDHPEGEPFEVDTVMQGERLEAFWKTVDLSEGQGAPWAPKPELLEILASL